MSPSGALVWDLDRLWIVRLAAKQGRGGVGNQVLLSCRLSWHHSQWETVLTCLCKSQWPCLAELSPTEGWSAVHSWDIWGVFPWEHLVGGSDGFWVVGHWCVGGPSFPNLRLQQAHSPNRRLT